MRSAPRRAKRRRSRSRRTAAGARAPPPRSSPCRAARRRRARRARSRISPYRARPRSSWERRRSRPGRRAAPARIPARPPRRSRHRPSRGRPAGSAWVVDALDEQEIAPVQADPFDAHPRFPGARLPGRARLDAQVVDAEAAAQRPSPVSHADPSPCALRLPPPADATETAAFSEPLSLISAGRPDDLNLLDSNQRYLSPYCLTVGASVRLGIANRGDCEFDLSDDGDSSAGPLMAAWR